METIFNRRKIDIEWTILRGQSHVREEFGRALVKLFLIGGGEKYLIDTLMTSNGVVTAEVPEGLPEGVYSVELIWVKNADSLRGTRWHDRCVSRAHKDGLFALTEYADEANNSATGPVRIQLTSQVATYGYDGLNAYETAVLRGDFTGTEGEWLRHERYVDLYETTGYSRTAGMTQRAITEEIEKLYKSISSVSVGGLALSQDTGDSEVLGMSQRAITLQLAYLQKQISQLQSGDIDMSITVTPSVFYRGVTNEVTTTVSLGKKANLITLYANDEVVMSVQENTELSYTSYLQESTNFRFIAMIDGMSYEREVTAHAAFPCYVGCGFSYEEVMGAGNKQTPRVSISGSYTVTVGQEGEHVFFIIPADMSIRRAELGGFEFPLTMEEREIGNVAYKVYKSENAYQAGELTLIVQ